MEMDMKNKTVTVFGDVDALSIGNKLRKSSPATEIIYVGPPKEPGKKEEAKKEKPKKEEGNKENAKKEEEPKKKVVLKLDVHDNKGKQKAMKVVSGLSGIDSIAIDVKGKKLTVIGAVDPVSLVSRLRKLWPTTDIDSVGPAKEPEKKEEAKKDEAKKEEGKKEETKEENKKEEAKKEEPKKEEAKKEEPKKEEERKKTPHELQIEELVKAYKALNPHVNTYYYSPSIEENPNACVIC